METDNYINALKRIQEHMDKGEFGRAAHRLDLLIYALEEMKKDKERDNA